MRIKRNDSGNPEPCCPHPDCDGSLAERAPERRSVHVVEVRAALLHSSGAEVMLTSSFAFRSSTASMSADRQAQKLLPMLDM